MAHRPDRFLPIYSELELSLVNLWINLGYLWKFGNLWDNFRNIRINFSCLWKCLEMFGQLQKYSDKLWVSLEVFGNLWDNFRNIQINFGYLRECLEIFEITSEIFVWASVILGSLWQIFG